MNFNMFNVEQAKGASMNFVDFRRGLHFYFSIDFEQCGLDDP